MRRAALVGWLLLSAPSWAMWTLVQHTYGPPTSCADSSHCTFDVPATGANHLLVLILSANNGYQLTSVSGGGSWVLPGGCFHNAGYYLDCAYVLSSSAGATSVSWANALNGNFHVGAEVLEYAYTGPSIALDRTGIRAPSDFMATQPGVTLALTGKNDVVIQAITSACQPSSVAAPFTDFADFFQSTDGLGRFGVAGAANTADGTAPMWTSVAGCSPAFNAVAFSEAPAPDAGTPDGGTGDGGPLADAGLADAGQRADGGLADGGQLADGGSVPQSYAVGCGCDVSGAPLGSVVLCFFALLRRRRTHPASAASPSAPGAAAQV